MGLGFKSGFDPPEAGQLAGLLKITPNRKHFAVLSCKILISVLVKRLRCRSRGGSTLGQGAYGTCPPDSLVVL